MFSLENKAVSCMMRFLITALAMTAAVLPGADSSLVDAVRQARRPEALRLIREGAGVNLPDRRGYTALMWAAANGDVEIATALLNQGAQVNARAENGMSAWALAVENGKETIVKLLLRAGADCQTAGPSNWDKKGLVIRNIVSRAIRQGEQLLKAADAGDLEAVKTLLATGAPVGYARPGPPPETALTIAARRGDTAMIRTLLAGAPVIGDEIQGASALMAAVNSRQPEVISVLLAANPPLAAVQNAVAAAPVELRPLFGRYAGLYNQIEQAVDSDDAPRVRDLIARGADPGWMLERAAQRDRVQALAVLLDSGARLDPTLADRAGPAAARILKNRSAEESLARTGRIRRLLVGVSEALSRLPDTPGVDPGLRNRERIMQPVRWLNARADNSRGVTETYIAELERSAELLTGAGVKSGAERAALMEDVASDLELKTRHCRELKIGMGGKIRLLVTTRHGSQPVNSWQVLYLPKIFQNAQGVSPGVVPGWSSPARETLEPGRYLIWARDPVSKRASEPLIVALAGREEIALDLAVP